MKKIKELTFLFMVMCLPSILFAQTTSFTSISEGVQSIELNSKNTGDKYKINVNLPFGYSNSQNSYPVLYSLDGNVTFGMVSDITKLISFEKPHSSVIVVGISYTTYNDWISKRGRDLMPSLKSTENIDNYLNFITNELIPLINQNFRTNNEENIIYGHSSGAIFGFYAMFKNPNLFKNYILTSPSVDEDGDYIKNMEKDFSESHNVLNIKLFTSMGKNEKQEFISSYNMFMQQLRERNYRSLSINSGVFDGSHMSTMAPAFVKGFEFIFSK